MTELSESSGSAPSGTEPTATATAELESSSRSWSTRSIVIVVIIAALVIGSIAGAIVALASARDDDDDVSVGASAPPATAPSDDTEAAPPPESIGPVCPASTVVVDDASSLQSALDNASPGAVIELAPGVYEGNFVATQSGNADSPITLCGPDSAVLDGGDIDKGYVLHLDGVSSWVVAGFTIRNGEKGLMADGLTASRIDGLTVTGIGHEAIHLRRTSTDNAVVGNTISDTGNTRDKFGEGIYIGTAESNWCDISDCEPDRSDRNLIENNTIFDTTAESVDIKEGTSGGIVRGNRFDGSSLSGADSWVDVKGSDWLIENNVGTNSPLDGFQTHEIVDGWGTRNVFRGNVATVNGPGFGFSLTPVLENVVRCDNAASAAGEGFANVSCRS